MDKNSLFYQIHNYKGDHPFTAGRAKFFFFDQEVAKQPFDKFIGSASSKHIGITYHQGNQLRILIDNYFVASLILNLGFAYNKIVKLILHTSNE